MRRSVLAIFPQLPFPEFSGDRQKVNKLISLLSRHFDLHAIIICREYATDEDENFLKQNTKTYKIVKLSKIKSLLGAFSFLIKGKSIQAGFFYDSSIQKVVDGLANTVDFLFCNAIRTSTYIENKNQLKFLDMVDTQSVHYERAIKKSASFLWRILYAQEARRLKKYEIEVLDKFNYIYLVNKYEIKKLQQSGRTNILYTPNGIKEELFAYTKVNKAIEQTNAISFIGKMDYQPNIDAVVWFMDNVFNLLNSDIQFYILGAQPTSKIKAYASDRVKVLGYLDDPYEIINSSKIVISPMQTGGGIQNKILEGMALGKINITTSLGVEGIIEAKNNVDILIANEAKDMADLVNNIVTDYNSYHAIGINARALVKENYSWAFFEQVIVTSIKQTIADN